MVHDCINNDPIILSATKPSNELVESLNPTFANISLIDEKYRIQFERNVTDEVSSYSIDVSSLFEKASIDDEVLGCPMTDYRIDKVMLGSTINEVERYSTLFSISSTGIFQIDDFTTPYDRYRIYISAYNSFKWSDFETQGWLIEITFGSGKEPFQVEIIDTPETEDVEPVVEEEIKEEVETQKIEPEDDNGPDPEI